MKRITVELTGAARALAGQKSVDVRIAQEGTYRDVVAELAKQFPALVGALIAPDQRSFLSANFFSRGGDNPVLPAEMDGIPEDGATLILLYFIVGG